MPKCCPFRIKLAWEMKWYVKLSKYRKRYLKKANSVQSTVIYTPPFKSHSWTFKGYFLSELKKKKKKKKYTPKMLSTSKNLLCIHVYLENDSTRFKTRHPLIKRGVTKIIRTTFYYLSHIKCWRDTCIFSHCVPIFRSTLYNMTMVQVSFPDVHTLRFLDCCFDNYLWFICLFIFFLLWNMQNNLKPR